MVPSLLIGSALGRLFGLIVTDIAGGVHSSSDVDWIDPGVFALIGAAAFFAGLTRLTMSLTVIMIELTNETHFLLPLMTAVMVARWTADAISDSLYHCLIQLKCLPFLPDEPHTAKCLELHSVRTHVWLFDTRNRTLVGALRSCHVHSISGARGDVRPCCHAPALRPRRGDCARADRVPPLGLPRGGARRARWQGRLQGGPGRCRRRCIALGSTIQSYPLFNAIRPRPPKFDDRARSCATTSSASWPARTCSWTRPPA